MTTCRNYYLDRVGGSFSAVDEQLQKPGPGEILLRTRRVSVCQSDVVIHKVGLPRIKRWPALILHEASCRLAHQLISGGKLPKLGLMTGADERFRPDQTLEAIRRACTPDSLKVIIDWD